MEKRIQIIDIARGIMIIAMVLYHFLYDLVFFCGLPYEYYKNPIADGIQFVICSVFILCSGAVSGRSNYKHALRIGVGAVIITLATYLFDDTNFVVFGILHFLALANLIYALIRRYTDKIPEIVQPFLWGALFAVSYIFLPATIDIPNLWIIGLPDAAFASSDYFPLFPWIFLYFFGTWMGKIIFSHRLPPSLYRVRSKSLAWIGRSSFYIYMVHQPILMGIVLLINRLK